MTKHDESRRAFLVGGAIGAGAAASVALVPEAFAKNRENDAAMDAPAANHAADHSAMTGMSGGHGAFFNDDDSRTITAFTERLMPGAPGKPGATDAGVLNYIDLALSGAYSDQQDFYRRGVTQLDAHCTKTYGKPFHRITAAQQDECITALEQGKAPEFAWPTAQAFFNTVRTHTMEGMFADPVYGGNKDFAGWRLVGFPGAQPQFTPEDMQSKEAFTREPIVGLQARAKSVNPAGKAEAMATEKTDVVIVGVGAAGGILAAELGKAGMKVIGLERGPRLKTSDFEPHDELRYFQRLDLRPLPKHDPVTWRPNANTRSSIYPVLGNGNQAGGGTVHYGALSWRMHEDDFRVRTKTTERYGASAIPQDSSLEDWPVNYAELEPFYDKAEHELGVSGKAGNLQGKKIDGGNVFEGSRSREYPLPALFVDQSGQLFEAGARKLGYHPFPSPHAILSQPYNDRPGCTYCGFCQSFGCHVGAKSSILVTKLPEADATGNFKLITGAMCYRVNSDNSGKVTGVSYYGPGRSDNTIEADIVIVAPFIYDNTRLMLLSKTEKFPNGLANSSGHLGKHIMSHVMVPVFATFDDRYVNNFMGPSAQKHSIDDFNADNFDHKDLGFIRGAQISIGTPNLQGGPISATTIAPPPGVPRWGAAYRDFLSKYYARHGALVAQTENLPYPDQTIDLDPDMRDAWGMPAPRLTYDWRRPNERARVAFMEQKMEEIGRAMGAPHVWGGPVSPAGAPGAHHEGGTRMGSDPKDSVVNKYGQTWDHSNLFLVGSSTFPTMGAGFNPTLTIQALAYMTADAIVNRYRKNPGSLI